MRTIEYSNRFRRDLKRELKGQHRKALEADLSALVDLLASDAPLPPRYQDHGLSGDWISYRDCHLKPDLVLIYRKIDSEILRLARIGSHADVLVVARLDRLARSTIDLLHIAERIKEKQAGLQSLDEPWADTTSPSGVMIMTVFAGIAQFERSLILKRTDEGRKAALARGVTFGRPKKMRPDQAELARQLVLDGKSISAVARTFNVHPATIYRCIEPNGSL